MTSLVIVGNKGDLHRQRPDDHPARLRACESRRRWLSGQPACAGDLPAAGRRRRALHPVGSDPLPASGWPAISAGDTLRAYGGQQMAGGSSAAHPLGDRCLSPLRRGGQPEYCRACASVGVLLSRYQRPEQLSDLRHPLLHVVGDLNEACAVARRPRRADPADHRQQRSGGLAGGTGGENAARPGAAGAGGGSAL